MYIEFRLPNGAGGMAAGYALSSIKHDIEIWAEKYNIPYKTKRHKLTFRLCLNTDKDYTQFILTWDPKFVVSKHFELKNPK
jgi:hypothetical protein